MHDFPPHRAHTPAPRPFSATASSFTTMGRSVEGTRDAHVLRSMARRWWSVLWRVLVLDLVPVLIAIGIFTTLFVCVIIMRGRDPHHVSFESVPAARDRLIVNALIMRCTIAIRTVIELVCHVARQPDGDGLPDQRALFSPSPAHPDCSAGHETACRPELKRCRSHFGIDYTYEDYSGADRRRPEGGPTSWCSHTVPRA